MSELSGITSPIITGAARSFNALGDNPVLGIKEASNQYKKIKEALKAKEAQKTSQENPKTAEIPTGADIRRALEEEAYR